MPFFVFVEQVNVLQLLFYYDFHLKTLSTDYLFGGIILHSKMIIIWEIILMINFVIQHVTHLITLLLLLV